MEGELLCVTGSALLYEGAWSVGADGSTRVPASRPSVLGSFLDGCEKGPLLRGNASDTFANPYRNGRPGLTECVNGWRGLSPPLHGTLHERPGSPGPPD